MSDHEFDYLCDCDECLAADAHIPITMKRSTWVMISRALTHDTDYYEQAAVIDEAIENYVHVMEVLATLQPGMPPC